MYKLYFDIFSKSILVINFYKSDFCSFAFKNIIVLVFRIGAKKIMLQFDIWIYTVAVLLKRKKTYSSPKKEKIS